MIVVDVDDLNRFVFVAEGDGPIRPLDQVIVDSALVVAVMQPSWSRKRVEATVIQSIDDRLGDDLHVVASGLGQEDPATRGFLRQRPHHFVGTWWILTENWCVLTFHRIQNRHFVVPFFLDVSIFDQLTVVRTDGNQWRRTVERAEREGHGQQPAEQDASAVAHHHHANRGE